MNRFKKVKIASIIGNFPISKIYVPNIPKIIWILYYFIVLLIIYFRRKNIELKSFSKIVKIILIIIILLCLTAMLPKDLEIHFLDVEQGDCTVIFTPSHKTILIDGGNNEGYDYGENTVLPYLLRNGVNKVDYIIVSHR